jgi:hypothetical protein
MPTNVANKLKAERPETAIDAHETNQTHLINAERAYLELSDHYNWHQVNCSANNIDPRSIDEIHQEVLSHAIKTIEPNEESSTYQTSSHNS